ncbi:MAG: SRPBCC family protein [Planctomycetes bacterium]|nr:SRPBCC family protein [Planctomycetota bacterium]
MNTTEFHYTTYLKSTPEKVWAAITTPEFASKYWGNANFSDWQAGSRWEHRTPTGTTVCTGLVRESVPPKRLVLSWVTPADFADESKHSRVTFAIDDIQGMVRLSVTHDQLEAGSDMATSISGGWPRVLSSLKSYLETGVALDTWAGQERSCHGK